MNNTFFLQQNHQAVEDGSFHNDIVSLSNENVLIAHEKAFQNKDDLNKMLNILESKIDNFQYIEISNSEIPLKDIISSYLLNSQLITNSKNNNNNSNYNINDDDNDNDNASASVLKTTSSV